MKENKVYVKYKLYELKTDKKFFVYRFYCVNGLSLSCQKMGVYSDKEKAVHLLNVLRQNYKGA